MADLRAHRVLDLLPESIRITAGLAAGALAIGGIFLVNANSHTLFHSLVSGRALAGVILSLVAGLTTIGLVYDRRYEPARYSAALAVVAGWALSRWPTILPGLTVDQAAAGHDTLVWVIVTVLGGAAILFPSLALLFRLAARGRFRAAQSPGLERAEQDPPVLDTGLVARVAIACLIAGFGLLMSPTPAGPTRWG